MYENFLDFEKREKWDLSVHQRSGFSLIHEDKENKTYTFI